MRTGAPGCGIRPEVARGHRLTQPVDVDAVFGLDFDAERVSRLRLDHGRKHDAVVEHEAILELRPREEACLLYTSPSPRD